MTLSGTPPQAPDGTTTAAAAGPSSAAPATGSDDSFGLVTTPGRWIEGWDPENRGQWLARGRRIARRNLGWSVYAEFLGFCVWAVWSVVVPQLNDAGFALSLDQQFWLIALPSLVGATLRVPYTFAVPLVGGRNWTIISSLLLILPATALAVVVTRPETSFGVLLLCAALAGFGGGNFASSMTNISFFYPEAEKGKALGINAAGGNLGTGIVQMLVPLVITIGAGVHLERAGLVFVPLALISAIAAWRGMDNLRGTTNDVGAFAVALRHPHTWIISFLYIGTFGSFIGYAGAFPTLLATQFPEAPTSLAFVGAIIGAVSRPLGGSLADKVGGARLTIVALLGLAVGALGAIAALRAESFVGFFAAFLLLFTCSGIGNGSTYRMIPAVFRSGVSAADLPVARKAAAGCIGIAGAVGAFGGFFIPRGFAMSTNAVGTLEPALLVFVGAYLLMAALTWTVYRRRGAALAAESI
ncbi:NarK family nitrate/nitrite MFS transporter [Janibacter alkaliphilus]|uniref:NNP family nitrate/nitrite transporter-like MFS transporter n=1 Tax=Janibacter alkaliphilus TaxID=1069963 RepID=A0A852X387_9MICO|nr:MFS transporter [Janibacter alkaliphilus]NYG36937.1 NNP family nitrate/nitrite transporter-like MFS transporter [Janibacter alkaliphilus]